VTFSKVAFLFPGQGSQSVGMGKDFYEQSKIGKEFFDRADQVLGRPLSKICFEGPEEELRKTWNAQPGLFLCGIIGYELLKAEGIEPAAAAGHSLGEYSAFYAARVFDLAQGLELVRVRGEAMNEASEARKGVMAAILGLEASKLQEVVKRASAKGIVTLANFNSPDQVVISGEPAAVEEAVALASADGAKRAIMLPVHGAFHSPLMSSAVPKMKAALEKAKLNDPEIDFISNFEASPVLNNEDVRHALSNQITSCVQWSKTIEAFICGGVDCFVEVGPGKVLSGLVRRINREAKTLNIGTMAELPGVVSQLKA